MNLGITAAQWLDDRVSAADPEALSLSGMLCLRSAAAAARHQDRTVATDLLDRAQAAAGLLGSAANYWQTGFGPTNVELHRLAAALDLGDVAYVIDRAPGVAVDHLPVERAVAHYIDTARAELGCSKRRSSRSTPDGRGQSTAAGAPQCGGARDHPGDAPPVARQRPHEVLHVVGARRAVPGRLMAVVSVVGCAAGGLEHLFDSLVVPLVDRGHRVTVTLTPAAARWLRADGGVARLEGLTGFEVRSEPRLPSTPRPHPEPDVIVAAPATANTVAKLALGIADNQALTVLCESVAVKPMVVFPRVNAAHARHPAWAGHIDALAAAGVRLVYGEDVWPLAEPRQASPTRGLPWQAIIDTVDKALSTA